MERETEEQMEQPERMEIGGLIKRISIQLRALADFDMKAYDLTWSQVHVLHHLSKHDGTMTQKELEKELGIAHPTMVGLIKRLESKGFIEAGTSETDHRMKIITATDKAHAHKQSMQENMKEKERIMTRGVTPEEEQVLRQCLQTVYQNLYEYREKVQNDGRFGYVAEPSEDAITDVATGTIEGVATSTMTDSINKGSAPSGSEEPARYDDRNNDKED